MSNFTETPAGADSLARRRLVCGVGINDSEYVTHKLINGRRITCPYYQLWSCMIKRCYSSAVAAHRPTYKGCSVCDEWLVFSVFKAWVSNQDWKGKQLDKDILHQGNKVYSPTNCMFVTKEINSLLLDCATRRGLLPMGVSAKRSKFRAQISLYGKRTIIGVYKTVAEAHEAYKKAKYAHIAEIANEQLEPLKSALLAYVVIDGAVYCEVSKQTKSKESNNG